MNDETSFFLCSHFLRREKHPFIEAEYDVSIKTNFNRSTSKPGSSWFLIAMDWWIRWEATSSSSIINSNDFTATNTSRKNSFIKSNKTDNRLISKFSFLSNQNTMTLCIILDENLVILIILH